MRVNKPTWILSALLLALTASLAQNATADSWHLNAKIPVGSHERETFIKDLLKHAPSNISSKDIEAFLNDPRADLIYDKAVVKIVAPSVKINQATEHQDRLKFLLKNSRLKACLQFEKDNAQVLAKTELASGVDRDVIASVLMWESGLGSNTGTYQIANVFLSQILFLDEGNAFALSKKQEKKFFNSSEQAQRVNRIREHAKSNLLSLISQCKKQEIDPFEVKGSWAGAIGIPQFMPESLSYAADGNGDGKIDLNAIPDAVASVGKYIAQHGYKKSVHDAIWAYNTDEAYVQGVLAFAQALKKYRQETLTYESK